MARRCASTGIVLQDHQVPTVILLRHGQSEWNTEGRFSGWIDVDLTPDGEQRARRAGEQLRVAGLLPDAVHTSLLTCACRTASLAVAAAGRAWVPVRRSWRLNERRYGALEGCRRADVRAEHGDLTYHSWRRSLHGSPPPGTAAAHAALVADPRYSGLGEALPRTESLADVVDRLLPYWSDALAPDLRVGRTPLVVGHSNSLRALICHLDGLTASEVPRLNLPTGMPLVYDLDDDLTPLVRGGRYLEPESARAAAADVAAQG